MKEIRAIVKAFDAAILAGKQCALATVVKVEGSAYRRAGARMLITVDGELTGTISGGCLEGDALRKARLVMTQHKPMLVTYDTMDDDDAKFGVGLGCNGIIHILIEPLFAEKSGCPINLFKAFLNRREAVVLVTLFSLENRLAVQPGTCLLIQKDETVIGEGAPFDFEGILVADGVEVLGSGKSTIKEYQAGIAYTAFIEFMPPNISLLIVGAGNDAIPVMEYAAILGWDITLIDGRANYAVETRFPKVKRIIVAKPEQALIDLIFDERTVVILMTHNFNYDKAMLQQVLPLNLVYIAALGPRKRLERMLTAIADEGMEINSQWLKNIYGPAGLDIGSENADEIALSIIAEIKAVLQGRVGTSLRYKATETDKTTSAQAKLIDNLFADKP